MATITLTTDFGRKDHFVAAVKGAILNEVSNTVIVDISHEISPFKITECAYVLKHAYPSFPKGTIHIIGVDSEWSPENEHLIAVIDGHYFIGANNGVLSLIASESGPEEIWKVDLPDSEVTAFPVKEVFAKVACHLVRGGRLEVVGKPYGQLKDLRDFEPRVSNAGATITGNIIYVDRYGNVVTNIHKTLFEAYRNGRDFELLVRTATIRNIYHSYNGGINYDLDRKQRNGAGDLLALFNAAGYIELAIYKSDMDSVGSILTLLGLKHLDVITINFL